MSAHAQLIAARIQDRLSTYQRIASEHGFQSTISLDCLVLYVPQTQHGKAIEDAQFFVRSMRELFLALGY